MILPNVHFPGVASHLLVSKKLSNFLSLTTVKVLISFIGCVRRNGPYILSPILTYRKFTQGRNFLPFLFSLKFLLLQSTPRQFLLPFVCFSGAIFLPASPCQFLFFWVLHFPLLFLTFFFLPQEIPSTVLVIIFECNNDIPLYAHSELIKYVSAISTNNYELAGKKRENP